MGKGSAIFSRCILISTATFYFALELIQLGRSAELKTRLSLQPHQTPDDYSYHSASDLNSQS